MPYKTIILFYLSTFLQNICLAQNDSLTLEQVLEKRVDTIVGLAIENEAFPGCVVYASQSGNPFFFKAYGYHTYDSLCEVNPDDLYDLASLSKVMAATLALMKLYELDLIALDSPIKDYVTGLRFRKIGKLTIRECLAHQSGLESWIRFYEEFQTKKDRYKRNTIGSKSSDKYPVQIAGQKYLHKDLYKKIKKIIKGARIDEDPHYRYSGLFFYLVPELVENVTGLAFEEFLKINFYDPLQAESLVFNPLGKYNPVRIVPTEIDSFFRYEPIHGRVHDEGAILMNGISGNAGLFGNANDVAKIWHLFLGLNSDSIQYLSPHTVQLFTSVQYPNKGNRRGLGFDKPLLEYDRDLSSVARSASVYSYGHTGFTGTLVWADPANEFLFIFLSNRVYPSRDHKAIYQLNIRPDIHQVLYDYLENVKK